MEVLVVMVGKGAQAGTETHEWVGRGPWELPAQPPPSKSGTGPAVNAHAEKIYQLAGMMHNSLLHGDTARIRFLLRANKG